MRPTCPPLSVSFVLRPPTANPEYYDILSYSECADMPTLTSKAEKIHKLAAQLQYNIDNWDAHHREEDRAAVVAAAQTMKKYIDDIIIALAAPSK